MTAENVYRNKSGYYALETHFLTIMAVLRRKKEVTAQLVEQGTGLVLHSALAIRDRKNGQILGLVIAKLEWGPKAKPPQDETEKTKASRSS